MAVIVVVDDSATDREYLREVLSPEHEVHTRSSWGAIDFDERQMADLFLLDVKMPGLSGDEIAKVILKHNPETKIVLFSALDEKELKRRTENVGATGWISKNESRESVRAKVRSFLTAH